MMVALQKVLSTIMLKMSKFAMDQIAAPVGSVVDSEDDSNIHGTVDNIETKAGVFPVKTVVRVVILRN